MISWFCGYFEAQSVLVSRESAGRFVAAFCAAPIYIVLYSHMEYLRYNWKLF